MLNRYAQKKRSARENQIREAKQEVKNYGKKLGEAKIRLSRAIKRHGDMRDSLANHTALLETINGQLPELQQMLASLAPSPLKAGMEVKVNKMIDQRDDSQKLIDRLTPKFEELTRYLEAYRLNVQAASSGYEFYTNFLDQLLKRPPSTGTDPQAPAA